MNNQMVLITEDEEEIQNLLSVLFASEGFSVLKASDGEEALALVRNHREKIVLLVTDLGLPRLGGIELITAAKSIVPGLHVIAASGFGHPTVRAKLLEVGVTTFFPKPYSPLELLAEAKRILKSS